MNATDLDYFTDLAAKFSTGTIVFDAYDMKVLADAGFSGTEEEAWAWLANCPYGNCAADGNGRDCAACGRDRHLANGSITRSQWARQAHAQIASLTEARDFDRLAAATTEIRRIATSN